MSKLKKLKSIQKDYSEQLVFFVKENNGIDNIQSNAFIEAMIYEVLNVIGK